MRDQWKKRTQHNVAKEKEMGKRAKELKLQENDPT